MTRAAVLAFLLGVLAGAAAHAGQQAPFKPWTQADADALRTKVMGYIGDIKRRLDQTRVEPYPWPSAVLTPSELRMLNECPQLTHWSAVYGRGSRDTDDDIAKMIVGCPVALDIVEGRQQ